MQGSWVVTYEDGTQLSQYDATQTEVPFRMIEWPRVKHVQFESQLAVSSFDVPAAPDGYAWSLRRRTWMCMDGTAVGAFLLILSRAGEEVGPNSVEYVLFWYPDGTTHETPFFTSKETDEYGSGVVHGLVHALVPSTGALKITVDALHTTSLV